MKQITSSQNAFIKSLVLIQEKPKARRQSGTFLIEGAREIGLARRGGFEILTLLVFLAKCTENEARRTAPEAELIEVTREVYQKLAYRESTEGLIAVARIKEVNLNELKLSDAPLILVAEAPEKPGNIGALLRTADAANVDAVIIANPRGDLFNPNIVRSSVGCVFTNQIATGTTEEVITWLKLNDIDIYCAALQNSTAYDKQDYKGATAIVVGTEADGLTQQWRDAAKQNIMIPMQGAIDSMNVSVAAAILIFEAKRQRGFK